jgi:proline dehydrogenase
MIPSIFEEFDPDCTGKIDYISWSMMLNPKDLPKITSTCRDVGPLAMATPTEEEVELIEAMYSRGHILAQEAATRGTRLLIDAEQVRFQPAIDKLVLDLQRQFNCADNTDKPIIYNTYQCYLKDASERLHTDVMRSERFNYHFGAKLVRGAYMESERALADKNSLPNPIHETIADTHKCYDDAVNFLLRHSTSSDKQVVEIMCASHNQTSIEKAIDSMNRNNVDRKSSTICFAQLYGMSDHLSFNLGKHGYRAYKYLPYGEVSKVMPYLLRRANENSAIVEGTTSELSMIRSELSRRLRKNMGLAI